MLNEMGGFVIDHPKTTCLILGLFEIITLLIIALDTALKQAC